MIIMVSCKHEPTSVIWIEGEKQSDKHAVHELVICNPPKGTEWDIWGVFDRTWTMPIVVSEDSDADMEVFDGVCVRITPRVEKDTLHVRYDNRYLNKQSRAPRGFNLKFRGNGKVVEVPVEYRFLPVPELVEDTYRNVPLSITDMIPQLKSVRMLQGSTNAGGAGTVLVDGKMPGWYRITIDGKVLVEAADESGRDYAGITLERLIENNGGNPELPNMIVEDWPDFQMRPLMIDVARNFIPAENLHTVIDLMYRAKMNTLLLHLSDDEGWRIEIDGLPELTSFGAFHAVPEYSGPDGEFHLAEGLFPAQNGKVGKKKPWISANGYYSRDEFKEILEYAASRHITVIPELDVPGHSSSAIEAMRYRARTTGDSSYLLTDEGDTSKFLAYQGFKDNVIDPGLPSTYKFLGHVFDDLKKIYSEAGFKLETINISGDEVAEGCWLGSPACGKLMEEHGFSTTEQLWSYFLDKVIDMLAERDLKFAGYAEVLVGTDEETLDKMRNNSSFIIVWRPLDDPAELNHIAYEFANKGFRMLLSHADHTYMDNAYYKHKAEHGLDWGGTTTERYAYSYNPLNLFDGSENAMPLLHPENIIGVEPMLWGDNIYDFETDCYLLFPKVYGLFERSWNATPGKDERDFDRFYSIVVSREIPYLDRNSIRHRNVMKTNEGE